MSDARVFLYRLDGHAAVPEPDTLRWARWFETADRTVARTEIAPAILVSTVFLGIDDGHLGLFETMVFGGSLEDFFSERYPTWDAAERGHDCVVLALRRAIR